MQHALNDLLNALGDNRDSSLLPLFDLLESLCEGAVLVDRQCRVVWISEKYHSLLGLPDGLKVIGREIEEIIPNSLMRQVVTTGQPQLLDLMRMDDRWFVVTRLPMKSRQGEVVGALGFVFFRELDYLKPLVDRFTRLQKAPATQQARETRYTFSDLVGASPEILTLRQQALRAAQLDTTLLLLGNTGTGKELLAQAIHAASSRSQGPFVGINTAALPEHLVEAELFGAAPGAYTGADRQGRQGKFELAQGGTLFLDEVGEMTAAVQSKLLRVLQEREVEPLGSNRVLKVDVRVIAATSRDLGEMVSEGKFRADLYYRLNVLPLTLPPLKDRLEDIPDLCQRINEIIADELGTQPLELTPSLISALQDYSWPGNIRELRNVLERAHLFADQGRVDVEGLAGLLPSQAIAKPESLTLADQVAATERRAIRDALKRTGGNKRKAAELLGISRATLYEKLQRLH